MDIGKAFTYVFEDPNWVMKLIIGGAILFVGIILSPLLLIPLLAAAAILLGYTLQVTRNVAEGSTTPLPAWGDFGTLFMRGLYALIGIIIYFLPVIILACCILILNAVAGSGSSTSFSGQTSSNSLTGVAAIVAICLNCIIFIYSLVAGVTLQAPLTRYAMGANQLAVFWDFRGNMDYISKNLSNYVIALLISWVASFIAGFGFILCLIGFFVTTFWAMLVQSYLSGQVWRNQAYPAAPAAPVMP